MRRIAFTLLLALSLQAQRGDHPGEPQPPLAPALVLPAPPPLSAAEALAALQVEQGLVVELFAAEPLVQTPVAIRFDAMGRLWVVEMRGYMPDVDGHDEERATGCIAVLEDTDGDGRADKRTEFAEDLVLPRAMAFVRGGILVLEPPWLRFFADADGDLVPESERILLANFSGRHSPEHAPNGLVQGLDNWLHWANHPARMRWDGQRLQVEPSLAHGQWGLSMDDWGRFYFNSNSDQLRAALMPAHWIAENPALRTAGLADIRIADDQSVFPIHITPGVNRGYQQGTLREGRLANFTGACAPLILRSDALGENRRGSAFVCEPCGNLVRRNVLHATASGLEARIAQPQQEFLASTDERFRPVGLTEGLDGALYVADMARGVIQHKLFVTTWLRRQIEARKLEEPLDLGRIWRVRAAQQPRQNAPQPARNSDAELVELLAHPTGTVRDHAQRLLLERNALAVVPALKSLLQREGAPLAKLHALRTLEGLQSLDSTSLLLALQDRAAEVRAEALLLLPVVAEKMEDSALRGALSAALKDRDARVVQHAALVLARVRGAASEELLLDLLTRDVPSLHTLALSGCLDREADLALALIRRGGGKALPTLLRHALVRRQTHGLLRVLAAATATPATQPTGFLTNALRAALQAENPRRALAFDTAPSDAIQHYILTDQVFQHHFTWPGREGGPSAPVQLDANERGLVERGKALFQFHCVACHQSNGRGMEGVAPSLAASERVPKAPDVIARILLDGFSSAGNGRSQYGTEMPRFNPLMDDDLAALATYVRRSFGHEESAVRAELVATLRQRHAQRGRPWTATELESGR